MSPEGVHHAHHHHNFGEARGSYSTFAVGKKRVRDEDDDIDVGRRQFGRASSEDDHMRTSPTPEAPVRNIKKARVNVTGRALPLSRIMEPMDSNALKQLIQNLCDRHPELLPEVSALAPRPTVQSALHTLEQYEKTLVENIPYGNKLNDYSFHRTKPHLMSLLDALLDYTQHFLPPQESQPSTSLAFLDGATQIIHRLPNWDNDVNNRHKMNAYEEMTKAWVLVISEAAKKGAGIAMQYGGWDVKLARHDEASGGRMQLAMIEMRNALMGGVDTAARAKKTTGFGFGLSTGTPVPVRSW